jgi:hypothetical protein
LQKYRINVFIRHRMFFLWLGWAFDNRCSPWQVGIDDFSPSLAATSGGPSLFMGEALGEARGCGHARACARVTLASACGMV